MTDTSRHWMIGIGLGLVAQMVYTMTLYPTVAYGDTGTLIAVAHTLGIAHPPGYPLYTMLAHVFTQLPFGSVAWKVNLASAVFGAGAVVFLYMTIAHLTRNVWAAVVAAGMYAFSPLVWHHALLAEVFSLNNLFATAIAYLSLRYHGERKAGTLYLLALLTGLGLSHHQSLVFWAAPVWVWLLWPQRKNLLGFRPLRVCVLLALLGLTPYLYLRLAAARAETAVVWGDLSSWLEFYRHVRRFQYGSFSLIPGAPGTAADSLRSVWFYFQHLPAQMLFAGAALAVWGVYCGLRDRTARAFMRATVVAFALYVLVFHALARLPIAENASMAAHIKKFWMMPNLFVFVWVGYGFHAVVTNTPAVMRSAATATVVLVGLQLGLNFASQNQSKNTFFYDHAKMKLEHLPPGSLMLTAGDTDNHTLMYVQECEGLRDDVTVVNLDMLKLYWAGPVVKKQMPGVVIPGEVLLPAPAPVRGPKIVSVRGTDVGERDMYSLSYLIDANIQSHPIYTTKFTGVQAFRGETSWNRDYVLLPMGSLYKVIRKGERVVFDDYIREAARFLPDLDGAGAHLHDEGSWEHITASKYWRDYQEQFAALMQKAREPGASVASLQTLASLMERFASVYPSPLQEAFYWDLALVYTWVLDYDASSLGALRELWNEKLKSSRAPSAQHDQRVRRALQ